jgi:hypothetical protein
MVPVDLDDLPAMDLAKRSKRDRYAGYQVYLESINFMAK